MSTIIFLNGISSAGKTSIAKILQNLIAQPYLHVTLDAFEDMMPDRYELGGAFEWTTLFPTVLSGFHHSIGALATAGNNLIVDHVMVHREGWHSSLAECLDVLRPFPVYFVGVRCPLDELKRREQARGDRSIGTVERQFPRVHQHELYDLEVDTSCASAEACAAQILAGIQVNPPFAFDCLRERQVAGAGIP